MILDIALYESTSQNSAKRILVKCDACGSERLVIKQNLMRAKNHDCKPCCNSRVGKATLGVKRSEQHRMKTAIASRGRKWSEEQRQRAKGLRTGLQNNKWNPDREAIARNETIRRSAYSLLWGTLRRIGSKKLAGSRALLGYSAKELATHIEAQFVDGMSWEDRSKWHIDHIKPVSVFVGEGVTDLMVINALNNLRPMWAAENMAKGSAY